MARRTTNSASGDSSPLESSSSGASLASDASPLDVLIASLTDLDSGQLCLQWRNHLGGTPPAHLPRWLLARVLAQRLQGAALGDLDKATLRMLRRAKGDGDDSIHWPFASREAATKHGVNLKAGALLIREWNGAVQRVMVLEQGFAWNGMTYNNLSQIAKAMTGASWNGHRFFGLRPAKLGIGGKVMRPAKSVADASGVERKELRAGDLRDQAIAHAATSAMVIANGADPASPPASLSTRSISDNARSPQREVAS